MNSKDVVSQPVFAHIHWADDHHCGLICCYWMRVTHQTFGLLTTCYCCANIKGIYMLTCTVFETCCILKYSPFRLLKHQLFIT